MSKDVVSLADVLTSAAGAFACANTRLMAAGAPALLREFTVRLGMSASPAIASGDLMLQGAFMPTAQQAALQGNGSAPNVEITAIVIAAPGTVPVPPT